jgi:glycosyltransferase involved in cell wall biosynthesis
VPGPIVSLNRFERKKNISLAIEAFALVCQGLSQAERRKLRLIIAGQ